jgi:hypothetical protein
MVEIVSAPLASTLAVFTILRAWVAAWRRFKHYRRLVLDSQTI